MFSDCRKLRFIADLAAVLFLAAYDTLKLTRLIAGQDGIIQIVLLGRSRWRVPYKKINTTRTP